MIGILLVILGVVCLTSSVVGFQQHRLEQRKPKELTEGEIEQMEIEVGVGKGFNIETKKIIGDLDKELYEVYSDLHPGQMDKTTEKFYHEYWKGYAEEVTAKAHLLSRVQPHILGPTGGNGVGVTGVTGPTGATIQTMDMKRPIRVATVDLNGQIKDAWW